MSHPPQGHYESAEREESPPIHVSCHSRDDIVAERDDCETLCAVISISTPGKEYEPIKWYAPVLELAFDDLDKEPALATRRAIGPTLTLFAADHARAIHEFVAGELADGVLRFLVHCDAGVSRSAAVAAALAKHYNRSDYWFRNQRSPNRLVYRVLLKALREGAVTP